MTTTRDYYGILGLAPGAGSDDIRHAYRRLAKLWHPDRYRLGPVPLREQAERRMRLLTEAYGVLGDAERRATYDATLGVGTSARVVAPGIPFGPTTRFTVPGHQFSRQWTAETSDENGLGTFLGLIFATIALMALVGIGGGHGGPGSLVALVIMLGAGFLAILSFTNQGIAHAAVQSAAARDRWEQASPTFSPGDLATRDVADLTSFEALIMEVLQDLPPEFGAELGNMTILVEPEPGWALLRRLGAQPGSTLLGLYEGVPLTKQAHGGPPLPERIAIFQGPIERHALFDPERIRHQVRATLLHELAHHFGMDHDEMPLWVKD